MYFIPLEWMVLEQQYCGILEVWGLHNSGFVRRNSCTLNAKIVLYLHSYFLFLTWYTPYQRGEKTTSLQEPGKLIKVYDFSQYLLPFPKKRTIFLCFCDEAMQPILCWWIRFEPLCTKLLIAHSPSTSERLRKFKSWGFHFQISILVFWCWRMPRCLLNLCLLFMLLFWDYTALNCLSELL